MLYLRCKFLVVFLHERRRYGTHTALVLAVERELREFRQHEEKLVLIAQLLDAVFEVDGCQRAQIMPFNERHNCNIILFYF